MKDEGMAQLLLYLAGDQRLSATVIEVPIKMTAYGWQIARVVRTVTHATDATTEDIPLEKMKVQGGAVVYAGYGPETNTLVFGTYTELDDEELGKHRQIDER